MKLKKILLENIRSYKQQEIEFAEGSTLLSGDIGSGKTSILLGIEFALFGLQPGQKGSSILANGANTARVVMEFEVDDKKIVIERTLKRAKTISQEYCSISVDGEKEEISVTEVKNRVLELLSYPKEFSKKQNILYKFTVYTPQEEMKQIILEDPETRINTLRHVFGIDKYKTILENTDIIISKIREERKIKEVLTLSLEQDKLDILYKEEEVEVKRKEFFKAEKEFSLRTVERKRIEREKENLNLERDKKLKFQQEIEKSKLMISNKQDTLLNNNKMIDQLKKQILELQGIKVEESKIKDLEKENETNKKERVSLSDRLLTISSQINSLNMKNNEDKFLKEKLSKIDICPTCLQDVDAVYKSNVFNKLDSSVSENVNKIKGFELEKTELLGKITKIDESLNLNQRKLSDLNIQRVKYQGITEKQTRMDDLEKMNLTLKADIEMLNSHMNLMKNSVLELSKFDNLFEEKSKELDNAFKIEKMAEIKMAELKKEIELSVRQIEETKLKIAKIELTRRELEYLVSLEEWLSKKFYSLIETIEKNVMAKLKQEFSKLFAEWFSMLVSENFNVKLDDNFTPIIEQKDYEIDYPYLSGGERTAIALAYRLALNRVINSVMSKIKTKDLVILDEPTDGFSDQQLDKMRDVLDELNVKQLIIVSHEQKIEGFVDNVIRFKKVNGYTERVN